MGMSKKDIMAKAEALAEHSELAQELYLGMDPDQTAAELKETLEAIVEVVEAETEDLADLHYGPIWKVGQGQTFVKVIARNQGDALAKAAEKMPLLLAIGMVATPEEDVEGFPVVALIPEDYQF
jgi:hypothetical protein